LRGNHLRVLDLDLENNQTVSSDALLVGEYGRLRNVSMGPDGNLYILTSNQDGRGNPVHNDDRILRITPLENNVHPESSVPSPLKQTQLGIPIQSISCNDGLSLIIKASNQMPACVKTSSIQKLVDLGWGIRN
ncbi:MAG: PQQ-dependent sugar dehydrogenase, partial [Nitrosopumilus sp.]|nr:PQQ-dependent sugar dehydrogenase [Nitrosopumilus sp.]